MTYRGKIKNGKVVFDGRVHLPEGTPVSVRPLKTERCRKKQEPIPTVYDRMEPFIGIADDLPEDASVNIDHYLYGAPKRP